MSPISPLNSETVPSIGDGIVTVALSVITSTNASSSFTIDPISTCHVTISPSTTPSPMSGSLNSYLVIFFSPPESFLLLQQFLLYWAYSPIQ